VSHSSVRVDSRAHHALTRAIISITHKASVSGDEPVSLFRRIYGLES
jgi:tetraacyldisaccharide-1-P 4'-kinase